MLIKQGYFLEYASVNPNYNTVSYIVALNSIFQRKYRQNEMISCCSILCKTNGIKCFRYPAQYFTNFQIGSTQCACIDKSYL